MKRRWSEVFDGPTGLAEWFGGWFPWRVRRQAEIIAERTAAAAERREAASRVWRAEGEAERAARWQRIQVEAAGARAEQIRRDAAETVRRAEAAARHAEQESNLARDQMARMQVTFTGVMQEHYAGAWARLTDGIFHAAQDHRPRMAVCVTAPEVRVDARLPRRGAVQTQEVPMVRFSFGVGLSEHTPPELVARELGRQVEAAVLKGWQGQSALLRGGR